MQEMAQRRERRAGVMRVQVWKTRFDPETLTPVSHLLRSLDVPVAAEAPQ